MLTVASSRPAYRRRHAGATDAARQDRVYGLTGPRSQDMNGVAREYSDALNREVTYSDIPPRIGNGS
jgi:hypothetical protein